MARDKVNLEASFFQEEYMHKNEKRKRRVILPK